MRGTIAANGLGLERQKVRMARALETTAWDEPVVAGNGDKLPSLEALVERLGYTLVYRREGILSGGADPGRSVIVVDSDFAPAQKVYVLAHELIHILGCQGESNCEYARAEMVTDMGAAMAGAVLGIDAFGAAADYVVLWRGLAGVDPRELATEAKVWAEMLLQALGEMEP